MLCESSERLQYENFEIETFSLSICFVCITSKFCSIVFQHRNLLLYISKLWVYWMNIVAVLKDAILEISLL